MKTVIKYVLLDLLRSRFIIFYTILLAVMSFSVMMLSDNTSKGIISLMNLTLLFVPFITILFSTIYFFNSSEFTELLLAQPLARKKVIMAQYGGVAVALTLAYLIGIGIPVFLILANKLSLVLVLAGMLLTLIFCSFALMVFVLFRDKTKGIGASIILAFFFTLLFDGLLMIFIYSFSDYPIDQAVIGMIALNPVDLARVLILLQLDVSVLMGYSGALFKKFLGSATGTLFSAGSMLFWILFPLMLSVKRFGKKDL